MKALVTGAAGFIGSHVARVLCERGHEVRALHRREDDLRNLRALPLETFAGDVSDPKSVREAVRGVDWVFHLAAIFSLDPRDRARMQKVNVDGTRIVLEAAREAGVRRTIHTSSIARFGGQGRRSRATEHSAFRLGPTGCAYSKTKNDAHEIAVRAAADGQDVVIVAPCGPIGPGDVGPTPTGRLLLTAVQMPFMVVTRSYTNFADVRDMATAHVAAASRGISGETYLLGARDIGFYDLAKTAQRVWGIERPIAIVPHRVASIGACIEVLRARVKNDRPLFTPASVRISRLGLRADCTKAIRDLGMPERSIEDSIYDALDWFAREGYLRGKYAQSA